MFDPVLAAIRFGVGLSAADPLPQRAEDLVAGLAGPDRTAEAIPIPRFAEARPPLPEFRAISRARRDQVGDPAVEAAYQAIRAEGRSAAIDRLRRAVIRAAWPADALRERLVGFWADHFTVRAKDTFSQHLVLPYVEEAIRPHVAGRFGDMLVAVVTHPMMLSYLDQTNSMGPNSPAAQRRDRGLNENLAREVLELHTVGVGGPYDQTDVRELAELLTGLGWDPDTARMVYRPERAEPGAETVLGLTFTRDASVATITDALQAIALLPATAAHLARKLAVHFVADDPPPALVEALAARWIASGGDLRAVSEEMVRHPDAWGPERRKVKQPVWFIASALRALGVGPDAMLAWDERQVTRVLTRPARVMGQDLGAPPGPDGWPEAPEAWVTPQGMAGRIDWAMTQPERLLPSLPDPREFVEVALGGLALGPLVFAAGAAEQGSDGIGLILSSPEFNRR